MTHKLLLLASAMIVGLPTVAQADVQGSFIGGFDTNPFKLRESLPSKETGFIDVGLRLDQAVGRGFGVDLRADATRYGTDAEEADQNTVSAALYYEGDTRAFGREITIGHRLKYTSQDKTYVSRTTGLVGTFGGTETPDRYDAGWFDIRSRMDIKIDDQWSLRVEANGRDKAYEDYTALGLSNLDYAQFGGDATLRFRPNRSNDIRLGGGYGKRQYDNRAGRDIAGAFVPGTNLEYTFTDLKASWKFELNERQDIRGSYDYATREDNVSGYFDTTLNEFGLRYRHKIQDNQRFVGKITYTDYEYDNLSAVAIVENEEPVGPKDGFRTSVGYEYGLNLNAEAEWTVVAELSHASYDSANPVYAFGRTKAWIGLEAKF
jgi:hypothetical protein